MPVSKASLVTLGAFVWVLGIGASFAALQRYAGQEGRAADPGDHANDFIAAHRAPGRALVVMAVHPLCPCTRASVAELGDLLARSRGTCDAILLEYRPSALSEGWPPFTASRELGGRQVRVIADRDGGIATALGAHTSGHAVFIAADGAIRFRGGLTLSRGHRGRSPAQDAILASLAGGEPKLESSPVYGCSLDAGCAIECQAEVGK